VGLAKARPMTGFQFPLDLLVRHLFHIPIRVDLLALMFFSRMFHATN